MKGAIELALWLVRTGIGLVLIYSGLLKVMHPYEFLNSVFGYHLLGPSAATLVAAVLPFVELTVGIALLCGVHMLGASLIAALLFGVFSVGQASILVRGISADCGCFGAGEPVSAVSLIRTLGLLMGTIFCFLCTIRRVAGPQQSVSNASTHVEPGSDGDFRLGRTINSVRDASAAGT